MKRLEHPFPHDCHAGDFWAAVAVLAVVCGPTAGLIVGSIWRMWGGAEPLAVGVSVGWVVFAAVPAVALWYAARAATGRDDRCTRCLERRVEDLR